MAGRRGETAGCLIQLANVSQPLTLACSAIRVTFMVETTKLYVAKVTYRNNKKVRFDPFHFHIFLRIIGQFKMPMTLTNVLESSLLQQACSKTCSTVFNDVNKRVQS